jgi:ABC-type bacteriocin/lantibiotic exporter with double-glycine peptidase domain
VGLQVVASTLLLGLGGWLVVKQQLTLGQLVAAELIVSVVLVGVSKLGRYLEKYYELCASVAKIDALFDIPIETLSGSFFSPGQEPAPLTISNLTVHHESVSRPILSELSLNIAAGDKVAIWGENGSGKSTLANCIYRLEDHKTGRVEIDGHDVREIHPLELRSEVALVRGVDIFHGTIEENLCLSTTQEISYTRIREVLAMVGLLEEIYALPDGLQTLLKGQWGPLSRGQVERLMIARALLMEPRLLIIDGALDGIDEAALKPLLEGLVGELSRCSVLVLTHDRLVHSLFPKQFILDKGTLRAVDSGGVHD